MLKSNMVSCLFSFSVLCQSKCIELKTIYASEELKQDATRKLGAPCMNSFVLSHEGSWIRQEQKHNLVKKRVFT